MPIFCLIRRTFVAVALLASASAAPALDSPPPLNLDHRHFTVSGLSSGAAMAVQMGVAHSSRVRGIGIVSGPPYLCAQGFVTKATNDCLTLGRELIRPYAARGLVERDQSRIQPTELGRRFLTDLQSLFLSAGRT